MHLQQIIAKWGWDGTLHLIIFTVNKFLNTTFGPFLHWTWPCWEAGQSAHETSKGGNICKTVLP